MKPFRTALLAFFALAPACFATQAYYSTTFDNFTAGDSVSYFVAPSPAPYGTYTPLSPTEGWITTDATQDDSVLDDSSPFAAYSGDQWGIMGGAVATSYGAPSQANVELYYPVNISDTFDFSTEFDVTSSNGAHPNNDTFGFTFRSVTDSLLCQILFTPDASSPGTYCDVGWNSTGSSSNDTSTGIEIERNGEYDVQVVGNLDDGAFEAIISTQGGSEVSFNGTMAGGDGQSLGEAGITWELANQGSTSSFGSNSIAFNNYTVVPEPSVTASLLLGSAALICWQRRKRFLS